MARRARKRGRYFDLVIAAHAHMLGPLRRGLGGLGEPRPQCWAWVHGREVWGPRGAALATDLAWADRTISVSRFTADQISQWVHTERVHVIPNAVDASLFTSLPDRSEIHRDEVLVVGRLSVQARNKGYEMLMRAIPRAQEKLGKPLRLSLVGDGDDRAPLEAVSAELGLTDRVRFRGRVGREELIEAYRHCGVFAMPSRVEKCDTEWFGEGFGIVYIEAAACGRPVIVSSDGGAPETVKAGETGLVVNPRDPEEIADAIVTILSEPDKSDTMGRAGRAWVEANFTLECFRERLHQLIHSEL